MCVAIGLTEHTDRGLARVRLKSQDRIGQDRTGKHAGRQAKTCVCVCVCRLFKGLIALSLAL